MLLFAKINNIPIRIYTTDDYSLEHTKTKTPIDQDTMIVLSHHGHAWLALDPKFDNDQTKRPLDCHCGYCVAIKKNHEPSKCA